MRHRPSMVLLNQGNKAAVEMLSREEVWPGCCIVNAFFKKTLKWYIMNIHLKTNAMHISKERKIFLFKP